MSEPQKHYIKFSSSQNVIMSKNENNTRECQIRVTGLEKKILQQRKTKKPKTEKPTHLKVSTEPHVTK